MTKLAADSYESSGSASSPELAGTPSRVEEREPKVARTIGLVGLFFVLFALLMMVWNWAHLTYEWSSMSWPWHVRFSPFMITLWLALGGAGTLFHAFQDRDQGIRRGYGFLAFALLLFGSVITSLSLVGGWLGGLEGQPSWLGPTIAGIVAGLLGLLIVGCAAAPFVEADIPSGLDIGSWKGLVVWKLRYPQRWLQGIRTSNRVQQITVAGLFATGVFIASGLLMHGINLLPYGLGALAIGFVYLIPYANNEREDAWRDAGLNLFGVIGAVAVALTIASSFTDLVGLPSIVMPYGVVAVFIGFPFLGAFIGFKGADSDVGYWCARALAYAGLALFVIAAVRSITPPIARTFLDNNDLPQYLLPGGFLLMTVGLMYLLLGGTLASDNRLLVLTRRELGVFLGPSIGWFVLAGMAGMAAFSFYLFISFLVPDDRFGGGAGQLVAEEPIVQNYFLEFIPLICLIMLVPLLTMRLLSEENRTGTIEVLLAAPITEWEIVLSKFLGVWIFNMIAWSLWAIFPLALWLYAGEPFDYRPILSFYLGIGAMTAGFLAMGLFFSSVTRNQIVAALLTTVVMVVMTIVVIFMFQLMADPAASQAKREALGYVSYYHHLMEFVRGRVHLRFVLFHVSLAIFWLFLTVKVLEARKWR